MTELTAGQINRILALVEGSPMLHYEWPGRGRAPTGYANGMAVTYALAYAKWKAGDPAELVMARANSGHTATDALAWYGSHFDDLDMSNAQDGADVLRHLWTLETGLGMRESSGKYCCGRDTSASNVTSDSAEAGLFQMSWGAHSASSEIPRLFAAYSANPDWGFKSIFSEGVGCSRADLQNYGSGDGRAFQALCKSSPAFAAEAAAVGMRVTGGSRGEWGPLRRHEAIISPECNRLYKAVQGVVDGVVSDGPRPVYDAGDIIRVMQARGITIDAPPGGYEIVYLEGADSAQDNFHFTPNANRPDAFDSLRMLVRPGVGGASPFIAGMWNATTHAGRYYEQVHLLNKGGAFHIATKKQKAWQHGIYHDYEALKQVLPLHGTRDRRRNFLREGPDIFEVVGAHHHWGYDYSKMSVQNAAAGCQVGEFDASHLKFIAMCKSDPRFQSNNSFIFSSTVLPVEWFVP